MRVSIEDTEVQQGILNKARRLAHENELLKETLARMQVVEPGQMDEPSMDSEDEELMRMRYFEALRRQHFEEQMRHQIDYRYSDSQSRGQPFKTPNAI